MKTQGRSLATAINILLIVIIVVMWIGFAGIVMGAVFLLANTDVVMEFMRVRDELALPDRTGMLMLMSVAGTIVLLTIQLLIRLRRVVGTVERGDPFHADNPRNLRIVAGLLAIVTAMGWVGQMLAPARGPLVDNFDFNLTSWLAVLIILVLAEVFREGTRLRADAELTV